MQTWLPFDQLWVRVHGCVAALSISCLSWQYFAVAQYEDIFPSTSSALACWYDIHVTSDQLID